MLVARVHRHSSQFGALNTLFTHKQTDCSKLESLFFTLFSLYLIGVDLNIKCPNFFLALISAYLHSSGNHTESQCLWSWFAPSARMLVQLLPLSALYWLSSGHASEKIIKEKQLRKVDKPIRRGALGDFIFRVIVMCALLFPLIMLCILDSIFSRCFWFGPMSRKLSFLVSSSFCPNSSLWLYCLELCFVFVWF